VKYFQKEEMKQLHCNITLSICLPLKFHWTKLLTNSFQT